MPRSSLRQLPLRFPIRHRPITFLFLGILRGNASTRLRQRSAVVLDWQALVKADDVIGFGGDVPAKMMFEIEGRLEEGG